MEVLLIIFPLILGFVLSIYAGLVVARFMNFDAAVNRARSIIFNLEQIWEYQFLEEKIDDPESPSGKRSLYMSQIVSSNRVSWQLTEIGLILKEYGHWSSALELDRIGEEVEALRLDFIEKAELAGGSLSIGILANLADWHRRVSALSPSFWRIVRPWANKKYKHLSCVEVDDSSGDFTEVHADQPETIFDTVDIGLKPRGANKPE